jgi:hypothetical protein
MEKNITQPRAHLLHLHEGLQANPNQKIKRRNTIPLKEVKRVASWERPPPKQRLAVNQTKTQSCVGIRSTANPALSLHTVVVSLREKRLRKG